MSTAIYLDSSALVKLVVAEAESEALRRFLRTHPIRVSSALAKVEVGRAVRFQGKPAALRATKVLARIRLLAIDNTLLEAAAALDGRVLRSLDAIHLASATALGNDLSSVITYDLRMRDSAQILGLSVRAPGAAGDIPRRRTKRVREH